MNFNDIDELKANGFRGFYTVRELWDNNVIPNTQGVYFILNINKDTDFLETGVGGHFKGRDPNVPVKTLQNNFIPEALVVYIGKSNNLKRRIRTYMIFGQGAPAAHMGGRFIWQIEHHAELIVCWKELPDNEDPRETERQLILEFKNQFNNQRPFANLQG